MKAHHFLPFVVFVVVALIAAVLVGKQTANIEPVATEKLSKFYENCIERTILNCQGKIRRYSSSRSKEILKAVKIFSKKEVFLRRNKQALVNEMLANNIERKQHKVNYFLDRAFFQDIRSNRLSDLHLKAAY